MNKPIIGGRIPLGREATMLREGLPTGEIPRQDDFAPKRGTSKIEYEEPGTGGIDEFDVSAFIMEAPPSALDRIIEQLLVRRRGNVMDVVGLVETAAYRLGMDRSSGAFNRFTEGLRAANTLDRDIDLPMIWFGLYEQALHLFNGQSGAGKSSVMYNIAMHLAIGKELWGIPVSAPQNIVYLDPENRVVRPHKLSRIAEKMGIEVPDNLHFHDGEGIDLSDPRTLKELGDLLMDKGATGLIIDPWVNLFGTLNENDNAEAARQGKALLDLIKRTGCWVVAVHHTGKSSEGGGRGASAREGVSRVIMDLVLPSMAREEDDDYNPERKQLREDFVRLMVRKDGIGGMKSSVYLQMLGEKAQDCFRRVSFREWMNNLREAAVSKGMSKEEQAGVMILEFLSDKYRVVPRKEIIDYFKSLGPKAPGVTAVNDALVTLTSGETPSLKEQYIGGKGGAKGYYLGTLDPATFVNEVTGTSAADDVNEMVELSAGKKQVDEEYVLPTDGVITPPPGAFEE